MAEAVRNFIQDSACLTSVYGEQLAIILGERTPAAPRGNQTGSPRLGRILLRPKTNRLNVAWGPWRNHEFFSPRSSSAQHLSPNGD